MTTTSVRTTVARRTIDREAVVYETLTECVDVFHSVGQMAEIAAFSIVFRIPVVSQFYLSRFITGRGEKNQCETPLLTVISTQLFQAKRVAVKIQ